MSNKLEDAISGLHFGENVKELYQLTENVASDFGKWKDTCEFFKGFGEATEFKRDNRKLFNYFINNIYKP